MNLNLMVFIQEIIFLKIKDCGICNKLDEYKSIGTHLITLYLNGNNWSTSYNETYLDSFEVEHIPKEIEKIIETKIL